MYNYRVVYRDGCTAFYLALVRYEFIWIKDKDGAYLFSDAGTARKTGEKALKFPQVAKGMMIEKG